MVDMTHEPPLKQFAGRAPAAELKRIRCARLSGHVGLLCKPRCKGVRSRSMLVRGTRADNDLNRSVPQRGDHGQCVRRAQNVTLALIHQLRSTRNIPDSAHSAKRSHYLGVTPTRAVSPRPAATQSPHRGVLSYIG